MFFHSSVGGHLDCLRTLAIVNNDAMDEHVSADNASNPDFHSFRHAERSGIARSYDSSSFNVEGGEEPPYCVP